MPELPNRIDGEIIEAEHMNAATIRSVQRYTSEAQRDALNPAPEDGQPAWIQDSDMLTIWSGSQWIVQTDQRNGSYLLLSGGTVVGVLNLDNIVNVNSSGIAFPGADFGGGTANQIGLRWKTPRVAVVVDNVLSYELADNADLAGYLLLTGGTLTGPLDAHSVNVQSGQIILHDDGSAEFNNGLVVDGYSNPPYTPQARNITASDIAPVDADGKDGDVYIWYDNGGSNTGARVYVRVSGIWRGSV